jgi:hypothetical protein
LLSTTPGLLHGTGLLFAWRKAIVSDNIAQARWIEAQTGLDLDVLFQFHPDRLIALAAQWRAAHAV